MKKFLSLIVVALMLVSILPLAAFAEDTVKASDFEITGKELTAEAGRDEDSNFDTLEFSIKFEGLDDGDEVWLWPVFEDDDASIREMKIEDKTVYRDSKHSVPLTYYELEEDGEEVTVTLTSSEAFKSNMFFAYVNGTKYGAVDKEDAIVNFDKTESLLIFTTDNSTVSFYAKNYEDALDQLEDYNDTHSPDVNLTGFTYPTEKVYSVNYKDCDDHVVGGKTDGVFEVEFTSVEDQVSVKKTTKENKDVYANGLDAHEVTATVKDRQKKPMKGAEVTFTIEEGIAFFANKATSVTATTDKNGEASVDVYSDIPGTNVKVKATYGDKDGVSDTLEFLSTGVTKVVAESDDNQKIALDGEVELKYSFFDANGNKVNYVKDSSGDGVLANLKEDYRATITVSEQPSSSKLDEKSFTVSADEGLLVLSYGNFKYEGNYQVKVHLVNGSEVTYNFNVKKAGAAASMSIEYGVAAIEKGATSAAPTIKYYDAEGYQVKDTFSEKYAVSNASIATIGNNDGKVKGLEEGSVVVTVYNDAKNLSASTTMIVGKAAAKLATTVPTAAINELITVDVQLVDADGNAVATGKDFPNGGNRKAIFTAKPENAVVSSLTVASKDWKNEGTAKVTFTAYTEGTYTFTVVIGTYSGTATVEVGKNAKFGAACVFMIGSESYMAGGQSFAGTSVAYVDANNRTMLGFRDLGAAIGATVKYEDGVATLTRGNVTVTAKAGDKFITVNGTQTAIDTEVVNKDGRLMLPFRAIFQAFGYTVSYSNGVIICK